MDILSLALIGLSLSMDAFAVAISNGIATEKLQPRHALKTAGFFSVFQALMPLLGWLLGTSVRRFIEGFDHWVAFALLAYIGVMMIIGALKNDEDNPAPDPYGTKRLLVMAVATSIDALCAGIALAMDGTNIWLGISIIGAITFAMCYMGVYIGKKVGSLFRKYSEIVGGTVLILIGLKIFIEHMFF